MLLLAQGLYLALAVAFGLTLELRAFAGGLPPMVLDALHRGAPSDLVALGLDLATAIGAIAAGVAMLLLRPWAWLVAMTLQGITLAAELAAYAYARPDYVNMAIAATIVFYLNTRTVRQAFARSWSPAAASDGGLAAD